MMSWVDEKIFPLHACIPLGREHVRLLQPLELRLGAPAAKMAALTFS